MFIVFFETDAGIRNECAVLDVLVAYKYQVSMKMLSESSTLLRILFRSGEKKQVTSAKLKIKI